MSKTAAFRKPLTGRCLRLSRVDWRTYSRLLQAFNERPGIRLTYDRGELEIMSPLYKHDGDGRSVGHMVLALTDELNLPIKCGGSTTLRRRLKKRGLEADECFWIANAHRLAGHERLDLRMDPPPDLAVEIDLTHSSMDRMGIYATLRVPEVWRVSGDTVSFFHLTVDGKYEEVAISPNFSLLTPAIVLDFLKRARQADDLNAVLRSFRIWIRQQVNQSNT